MLLTAAPSICLQHSWCTNTACRLPCTWQVHSRHSGHGGRTVLQLPVSSNCESRWHTCLLLQQEALVRQAASAAEQLQNRGWR